MWSVVGGRDLGRGGGGGGGGGGGVTYQAKLFFKLFVVLIKK